MKLTRWYKSLSKRLLALTMVWVTFVTCTLGYTMFLSQRVQLSGVYQNEVAELQSHIFRLNILVNPTFNESEFRSEYHIIDSTLERITSPEASKTFLMSESEVEALSSIHHLWKSQLAPLFIQARTNSKPLTPETAEAFVRHISDVQQLITGKRNDSLTAQRLVQAFLMVLAVGSLFGIMWCLFDWVIRPTEKVREGLSNVREGELGTRVHLAGSAEFEAIGTDFNAMAGRLQDLVENLEAKVKEKTEAVEEKNRNMSHLYEMTSFVTQQHNVDEMCEGFAQRLMQFTNADACAVFLIDRKRRLIELAASLDLPAKTFSYFSLNPLPLEEVEASLKSDLPLRITPEMPEDFLSMLRIEASEGFKTAYLFHIRSGGKNIGFYLLYYRDLVKLIQQTYKLYENFGTHLGIAVDNLRLIERDQQYAVVQERNLMAQGLHDSIAQSLSFLNLQIQLLESGLASNDKELIDATVPLIKAGVQESYEDVRELLLNFRERVHTESFSEAIETVIGRFESQTKLKVKLTATGNGQELTDKQKIQVIFIMQEALANVRKHSKASAVEIQIRNDEDFELSVIDNGVGINEAILAERSKRHVGLNIMRERAERIGAVVKVGSAPKNLFDSGTCVNLIISGAAR